MEKKIQIEKAYTHAGKFHSDDVFSAAFLRILNPDIQIERGNQPPEGFDGIVFDIGLGEFDHHQKNKAVRDDEGKTPYAAFGLLWRKYGPLLFAQEEVEHFDEKFVALLDLSDNTGCSHPLAFAIADFNPVWDDKETKSDDRFFEAVDMAEKILRYKFERMYASERAKERVERCLQKSQDHILILEESMPWKRFVKETDIYFVIYPSNRGGYSIQAVPDDTVEEENEILKLPFPEAWRGMDAQTIQRESGTKTARFCHTSGFLAAADTLEDAIAMAKFTMEDAGK